MKNTSSRLFQKLKAMKFKHRLILTGTPLQNNTKELWSLLHFLDSEKFNDCDSFLKIFGELKERNQVDQLRELLAPYLLRRLKEDVDTSIPPKEETIIEIELTSTQKAYYR